MTTLRAAAERALAWLDRETPFTRDEAYEEKQAIQRDFRAALAEHYCDTHCTWADHAPGCIRAEPEPTCNGMPAIEGPLSRSQRMPAPLNLNDPAVQKRLAAQWGYAPQRKPLSEKGIKRIDNSTHFHESPDWSLRFARAIERAHGIGGNDA